MLSSTLGVGSKPSDNVILLSPFKYDRHLSRSVFQNLTGLTYEPVAAKLLSRLLFIRVVSIMHCTIVVLCPISW